MQTLEKRFWSQVQKSEGCWEWLGNKLPTGYGRIWIGSRNERAHRVSYSLAVGTIPSGAQVLHRCDNPGCVSPAHLFLGNPTVNLRDCRDKGRGPCQTLDWVKVREMRRLYSLGNITQVELAAKYNISQSSVSRTLLDQTWQQG